MAGLFNIDSPTPAFKPSKAPAFSFNAPTTRTTGGSGMFRTSAQQMGGGKKERGSPVRESSDESWANVGGDELTSETDHDIDDSRASTHRPEESTMMEEEETLDIGDYSQEIDNFAFELDNSNIQTDENGELVNAAGDGFDLIERFKNRASDEVERLNNLALEASEEELPDIEAERKHWELENQTWDLFARLAAHRKQGANSVRIPDHLLRNRFSSNQHIRNFLFENDSTYQELALVLDWLQTYAPIPEDELLDRDGNPTAEGGWLYTREKIKSDKRKGSKALSFGFGTKGRDDVVKTLDPDAPTREQKNLEEEDEIKTRLLMKAVWSYLRKGDVPAAQLYCEEAGEWWRAASLAGADEAWDDTVDGIMANDGDETMDDFGRRVRGNKRRELWKRMCFALARRPEVDTYERAVYGTLCGDIESVTPACQTWEDFLFAHFNSLAEGYYTQALTSVNRIPPSVTQFPTFDSIAYHSLGSNILNNDIILRLIIDSVTAQCKDVPDARLSLRVLQGALISHRLEEKIEQIHRQYNKISADPNAEISDDVEITDVRLLRVLVHLILSLDSIGEGFKPGTPIHAKAETVIGAYINILGELEKFQVMPLYAKRLSRKKQIEVVGKEMLRIDDDKRREELIDLMQIHGVDFNACLRETMRLAFVAAGPLWNELAFDQDTLADGFEGPLYGEEEQLISALKWLVMCGDALRSDAIISAAEVYKKFLLAGRLSACKALLDQIKSVDIIPPEKEDTYAEIISGAGGSPMEASAAWESGETKEASAIWIDLEGLTVALVALDDWNVAVKNRPEYGPPNLSRDTKAQLQSLYDEASNLLLDAVEGLLASPALHSLPDIRRIRTLYVPELVLALHKLHVDAARILNKNYLAKTLHLSVLVADPEKNVLECFEREKLRAYVDALAEGSRGILGEHGKGALPEMRIWNVEV